MKRLTLSFFSAMAIMIAIAATAAGFTSPKPAPDEDKLHWFRASDGEYIGFAYPSVMEAGVCLGNGTPCANGYSLITGDPGEEVPVLPSFVTLIQKT